MIRKMLARREAGRDEGFTLIELMIVVTIIGILAAVAIPRYINYMKSSQTAEVSNMAGILVTAMQAYEDAQGATPASIVTLFSGYTLAPSGTVPAKDITSILPQISLPANAAFSYTVSALAATAGPQTGDVAYCITATGNANSGNLNGIVLYSSAPALTSTGGWIGRMFNKPYITGTATLVAGGYCAVTGVAQATQT